MQLSAVVPALLALLAAQPAQARATPRAPLRAAVQHRLHAHGGSPAMLRRSTSRADVQFGSYWFTAATAGGQAVDVLIDTGSSDLWLLGPNVAAEQQAKQQLYDPKRSSGAAALATSTFNISYGQGNNGVAGAVYTDAFSMGGATVAHMAIGSANALTGLPGGIFKSGIVGLAFGAANTVQPTPQATFMEALQGQLDAPVFVCNFKMGGGGFIEFGAVDDALFSGPLTTLAADNTTTYPGSWSSLGVEYAAGGSTLGTFDLVFDTGGPTTTGPLSVVRAYYAQVKGARDVNGDGKAWAVPCDASLPDLQLRFGGGAVATIPGAKLIQAPNGDGSCSTWFATEDSRTRGLVGDAFFNSHVVVFNQANATIAWAPQA